MSKTKDVTAITIRVTPDAMKELRLLKRKKGGSISGIVRSWLMEKLVEEKEYYSEIGEKR